jgi:hypothetical protein
MKIKCVKTFTDNPDKSIMNYDIGEYLSIGNVFWVYGMRVSTNVTYFYIFQDEYLVEIPSVMFEILDDNVPREWKIKVWSNNEITLWPPLFYEDSFFENFAEWEQKERQMFETLRIAIEQPGLIVNVYNKKDKQYLYLIISMFVAEKINEEEFCSEYNNSYALELDYSTLTEKENLLFSELSKVVSQFSEHPEDRQLDPTVSLSKESLRKKIIETKYALLSVAQT